MGRKPHFRTKLEREAMRVDIARRAARGETLRTISKATGMSVTQVHRDLRAVREEWEEQRLDSTQDLRARELQRLDTLERELLDSWERSKKDQLVITNFVAGKNRSKSSTRSKRHGDARIIQQLHRCIEQRRALLNLDAPKPEDERTRLTEQLADVFCALLERHLYRHPEILRRILGDIGAMRGRREPDMLDAEIEPADPPDDPEGDSEQ